LYLVLVIKELGYTSTKAQLLSVPPYAAAAIFTIFIGYVGDRTQQRGISSMAVSLIGVVGFAMILGSTRPGVKYGEHVSIS